MLEQLASKLWGLCLLYTLQWTLYGWGILYSSALELRKMSSLCPALDFWKPAQAFLHSQSRLVFEGILRVLPVHPQTSELILECQRMFPLAFLILPPRLISGNFVEFSFPFPSFSTQKEKERAGSRTVLFHVSGCSEFKPSCQTSWQHLQMPW